MEIAQVSAFTSIPAKEKITLFPFYRHTSSGRQDYLPRGTQEDDTNATIYNYGYFSHSYI